MFARKSTLAFLLAISLFLSGCAIIDKISAPSLKGDSSTSSVVVVKCEATWRGVLGIKESQQVVSGVLLSTDGTRRVNGQGVADLIIFSDVSPGEYNLARVQTTRQVGNMIWQQTYNIPGENVLDYVFSVKAGEPKYIGVVTVEEIQKFTERRVIFGLKPSKEAETAAWEKFTNLYQGSSWANEVQKRISELKR